MSHFRNLVRAYKHHPDHHTELSENLRCRQNSPVIAQLSTAGLNNFRRQQLSLAKINMALSRQCGLYGKHCDLSGDFTLSGDNLFVTPSNATQSSVVKTYAASRLQLVVAPD